MKFSKQIIRQKMKLSKQIIRQKMKFSKQIICRKMKLSKQIILKKGRFRTCELSKFGQLFLLDTYSQCVFLCLTQ